MNLRKARREAAEREARDARRLAQLERQHLESQPECSARNQQTKPERNDQ